MRWRICGAEKRETKRRSTEYTEKKSERQEGHDVSCPYKTAGNKIYGGKLKDLSFVSTQTLTTFVFWLFSGSLLAMGMGENGLIATRTSTLVVEPFGDLVLRML
jgi:hypothetical protein